MTCEDSIKCVLSVSSIENENDISPIMQNTIIILISSLSAHFNENHNPHVDDNDEEVPMNVECHICSEIMLKLICNQLSMLNDQTNILTMNNMEMHAQYDTTNLHIEDDTSDISKTYESSEVKHSKKKSSSGGGFNACKEEELEEEICKELEVKK